MKYKERKCVDCKKVTANIRKERCTKCYLRDLRKRKRLVG